MQKVTNNQIGHFNKLGHLLKFFQAIDKLGEMFEENAQKIRENWKKKADNKPENKM